jgi:hypothetical protein
VKTINTVFLLLIVSLPATAILRTSKEPIGAETVPATMTVTAEGKQDTTPPAIAKQDVQVYQANERREIAHWDPISGKFSVAVLIDDSLNPAIAHNVQDIAAWVRGLPDTVPVMVGYARNGTADVVQDFTTEHAAAAKALRMPVGIPGAFTSIYYSLQDLMKRWKPSTGAREIVLVSDGIDRLHGGFSFYSPDLQPTIERAQRGNFVIYTLYARAFDGHGRHLFRINEGQSALSMLADLTGGEAFFQGLDTPISYQPYLQNLSKLFQQQYTLVFQAKPGTQSGLQEVRVLTELPKVEIDAAEQAYVSLPGQHSE